jgi:hypothetical protein
LVTLLTEWSAAAVTQYGFSWEDAENFLCDILTCDKSWEVGELSRKPQRQEFLIRHLRILTQMLEAVQRYRELLPAEGFDQWPNPHWAFCRRSKILEIAYQWEQQGYGGVEAVAEALLERCARQDETEIAQKRKEPSDYFPETNENCRLATLLAAGQRERLFRLLAALIPRQLYPEPPLKGWLFLDRHGNVQEFLRQCSDRPELLPRLRKLLQRLALAVRLQSQDRLHRALVQWENLPPAEVPPPQNGTIGPDYERELGQLLAYRTLAGQPAAWPSAIAEILHRPQAWQRELEALEEQQRSGTLPPSAILRLANLRTYLADPHRLDEWVARDLSAALVKHLPLAQLEALENLVHTAIKAHWQPVLGKANLPEENPDWDNALHLYYTTRKNKRLLRELLRHEARGDREWIRQHPANQSFAERASAAGVDVDVWLGPHERTLVLPGETWTAYAETHPLKVLQMGNLFGTCLSVGDVNAFSTIANAVEVNKRVLYLRNDRGHVIGRKLIVLTRQGELVGFRSYGAALWHDSSEGSPWIKILFDLLCRDLARRSGARFPARAEEIEDKDLRLFAQWYFDDPEPFDWWVAGPGANDAALETGDVTPLVDALLRHFREKDSAEMQEGNGLPATLRALLWLGEAALPVLAEVRNSSYGDAQDLEYLLRFSQSDLVRSTLRQWLNT